MVSVLPPEVVMKLREKLGKEEALEFIKALDEAVKELTVRRKLELRDELAKELVTKADLREAMAKTWEEMAKFRGEVARLEGQISLVKCEVTELKAELRKLGGYLKIIILLFPLAIALYSPVFFELVKTFIKV